MAQITDPKALPVATPLAAGEGWSVSEIHCNAGPGERPFEERHESFSVAAVVEGTFSYHGKSGRAALAPGALLLGNASACYACGHDHGRGDRCISLAVSTTLFEEVAASSAGSSRFQFPSAMTVAAGASLSAFMGLQLWPTEQAVPAENRALAILENTLAHVSGTAKRGQTVSARDVARAREAVALIEAGPDADLDLARLSTSAGMSRYHFLRVFRRVTGVTPYQYLLAARLRRAALALARTAEPVTAIAYRAGFGDLSTFNWRFRKTFGATPSVWRRRH